MIRASTTLITWLTSVLKLCVAVMNNPELPLDPNLQTSNLLITFLKYASIVMQDTKGLSAFTLLQSFTWIVLALCWPFSTESPVPKHLLHNMSVCFSDEHRLNSARLCLIILTCIAEVRCRISPIYSLGPGGFQVYFGHFIRTWKLCFLAGSVCWCFPARWQRELQSQSPQNGESVFECVTQGGILLHF